METETIIIVVNGFEEKVPSGASLEWLIRLFNEGDADLITEHNGRFVYSRDYASTRVADGDRIEFINPNFGG